MRRSVQNVQHSAGISHCNVSVVTRDADVNEGGGGERVVAQGAALGGAPRCDPALLAASVPDQMLQ